MQTPQRSRTWPERLVARFFLTRPGIWFGYHVLPRLDRPLLSLSRGRLSMSPGQPILLLLTVGAKSGQWRATPLLYLRDGDRVVVIASNGGRAHHPAWYYNLRAHPEARVLLRGREGIYMAHEAQGEERAALWRKEVGYFVGFSLYEQRAARHIPVMVLTPRSTYGPALTAGSGAPITRWAATASHASARPVRAIRAPPGRCAVRFARSWQCHSPGMGPDW